MMMTRKVKIFAKMQLTIPKRQEKTRTSKPWFKKNKMEAGNKMSEKVKKI